MINFEQFESRGREKIRKSRLLTRLDVKKTQVEGRGAMILVPFHHPGGSFGVVPFRQRAGNFSLLLATSRYVRYYVLLRSLPWDREDRQKGVRIVAADIKDIPPPSPPPADKRTRPFSPAITAKPLTNLRRPDNPLSSPTYSTY